MTGNRRDFIKATAAIGMLGGTQAQAAAANDSWIAFLHSTHLDPDWQAAFLSGLRRSRLEGDPQNSAGGMTSVKIEYFNAGSNYRSKSSDNANLKTAVQNMIQNACSTPKLFMATGGMVSALAAADANIDIPCLVIMGRNYDFGGRASAASFSTMSRTAATPTCSRR